MHACRGLPGVELVAVCDAYKGRAEHAKAITGGEARIHADYREILDANDVDAVFIGSPDHWHRQMSLDALSAGKDVYIEKPMTYTVDEGLEIIAATEKSDRIYLCWFSVKMTARLDVNATPGVRMSPLAPGIVPECSGASRVKRAARAGFAALDSPCALWYSLLVGERERSGAPGIRVFMRAPCYYAAHAAPLVPAPVSGPAPTRSLGPCQP